MRKKKKAIKELSDKEVRNRVLKQIRKGRKVGKWK